MQPAARNSAQDAITRFRGGYGNLLEWVVIVLMVVLAIEVTLGVVFRSIGKSVAWYDEVASILLAWLTFYGSALASVKRAHIGCPELVERLSWRVRRLTGIAAQLLVIAFFAVLGGVGAWILPVLASDMMVSLPSVSIAVVQSVIPISAALIIVAEITYLIDLIADNRPPTDSGSIGLAEGLH